MAKSTSDIYMNYREMEKKASRLEELASELRSVAENQVAYYGENRNAWRGDSGDECRKKVTKLKNNINKRAAELQRAAVLLRRTAQRQYKLEMQLAQMFLR